MIYVYVHKNFVSPICWLSCLFVVAVVFVVSRLCLVNLLPLVWMPHVL